MRVLVTGGAGFIGSHLCERLLARGAFVRVLDDLSTGKPENLERCRSHAGFEFREGSILDEGSVRAAARGVEGIFHLAALVGVQLVLERPSATIETNALGTRHVLDAAEAAGARVFLASSSEVYGRSARLPLRDDDPLLLGATREARWSYACSKALGEWLALARARERRLSVTIARFFNVVGPRQSGAHGMVLPRFVAAAVAGRPIPVHGDGSQTRCFLHVQDALEAVLALWDEPRAHSQVFNVGSERETPILALAELVRAAAGGRSPIERRPYRDVYGNELQDLPRRLPDTSRLRALTGWRPRVALEDLIGELVRDAAGVELSV
jgi:UDP-glucose 4-epimerase